MTEYGDILRLCGCAVTALVCLLIVRAQDRGGSVGTVISLGCTVLLTVSVLGAVFPLFTRLRTLAEPYLSEDCAAVLFRGCAIGMTTELTSGLIRDAGEGALADKVEFAGRAALLAVGMPLLSELLSLAKTFLTF